MRIDLQTPAAQDIERSPDLKQAERQRASRGKTGDDASLSLSSDTAQSISAALDADPEIRSDRVEQLRALVNSGQYAVEPARVANAMYTSLFGMR